MPFPLAHPAAVFPLRRWCSRHLSLSALVIGSICPDTGYCFPFVASFSHRFVAGAFEFCLPMGLLMWGFFFLTNNSLVRILPGSYRKVLLPLCQKPGPTPTSLVGSLLIGIWTHLFLDSICHQDGLVVQHLPLLQARVLILGNQAYQLCDVLYMILTFGGIYWISLVYLNWLTRVRISRRALPKAVLWGWPAIAASGVVAFCMFSRGPLPPINTFGLLIITLSILTGFLILTGLLLNRRLTTA